MSFNYLEQLAAEWYEFNGFFIRKNLFVGKLPAGGYEGELDIVGFNPDTERIIHVEPTMDAHSWAKREERFRKKFDAGKKYIPEVFGKFKIISPDDIEQIVLLGYGSNVNHPTLAGGKVVTIGEFLGEILRGVGQNSIYSNAVPEQFPLLRTLQFVAECKQTVIEILETLGKSQK